MIEIIELGLGNIATPMILCFVLGGAAALAGSDLEVPDALGRGMALYLMFAIGFKGGQALADGGAGGAVLAGLLAATVVSFAIPFLAYAILRTGVGLDRIQAAAVGAHYGSISVVTFITAVEFLHFLDIPFEGYLVAMMAIMETPAIVSGLWLARRDVGGAGKKGFFASLSPRLLKEIFLNASIVLLLGGFLIGWATGERGYTLIKPFVYDLFNGVLCFFLLDMGLLAARQAQSVAVLRPSLIAFGLGMPLLGAAVALAASAVLGLSLGGTLLFMILSASASYIAVPAAMRLALPEASPAIYVTLSLAVTFPFNVVVGIPLYFGVARSLVGG